MEYFGDEHVIALQKSVRAMAGQIAGEPLLSNGGRILNILDPESYGWDKLRKDVERDRFVGLTMVDRDKTLAHLKSEFGPGAEFPYWNNYVGLPEQVIPACIALNANNHLPQNWTMKSFGHPSEDVIDQSQQLNQLTGVAPTPAYYLRGDYLPSMLSCIYDENGKLAACASATMRYHPKGPLSGWLFAGGVSVSPDHRRKGLGSIVNAELLLNSHEAYDWCNVLEQAKADNAASVGMITRCGLVHQIGKATIVINLSGADLTR